MLDDATNYFRVTSVDNSGLESNFSRQIEVTTGFLTSVENFDDVVPEGFTLRPNYPNPFSTSTKFVFTLTGSEIPDVFTIQIMTISGKVVREITKEIKIIQRDC